MEQEPKQQGGCGMALLWLGAASVFVAVILLAALTWGREEPTVPAMLQLSAQTVETGSEAQESRMVIPLGKAVGIKLFYWNYPFVRYALIVGVLIARTAA